MARRRLLIFLLVTSLTPVFGETPDRSTWPAYIQSAEEHAKNYYRFDLLHRKVNQKDQWIVLLGERHNQSAEALEDGKNAVSGFQIIGYELSYPLKPSELSRFPPAYSNSLILAVIKQSVPSQRKIWLEEDHEPDMLQTIEDLFPNIAAFGAASAISLAAGSCKPLFVHLFKNPDAARRARRIVLMGSLVGLTSAAALSIPKGLAVAYPDQRSSGMMGGRNVAMTAVATNIMNEEGLPESMALVMGAKHNKGVAFHLQKSGFTTVYSHVGTQPRR